MPIELVFAICFLCIIIALLTTGGYAIEFFDEYKTIPGYIPLIFIAISLLSGLWIAASFQTDIKVDKQKIVSPVNIDGSEIVYFDDHTWNVNSEFGQNFNDSSKFKIKLYKRGFYFGIWRSKFPTIEIVK